MKASTTSATAFLQGLVYDYNRLLFELQAREGQQISIGNAVVRAENEGRAGEVLRLRAEADRLDRETSLDLAFVTRLHEFIDECSRLLNHPGPS